MNRWFPIETARLLLREFRADDFDDIHAYASDLEVVRLMIWGPNTPEMTQTFLSGMLKAQETWPRSAVELVLELKGDRRVIGAIGLRLKDERNRTADIGYVLNRSNWGCGYTTEAARAILDAAFRQLKFHRIWAMCDTRNHASYRVMEKLGMRREAHFHRDALEKGEWRDTYLYAILAEEWLARPGNPAA
jgi:ribosomal-protein-alanine N-acetyltransferase